MEDKEKIHPVRKAAEREARRYGYEVRPTVVKDSDEARRLEEGFAIMEDDTNDR